MKRNPDAKPATEASPDGGFLHRWSRQKVAARARTDPAGSRATPATTSTPDSKNEPELTDADMPPIESLTPDSDFRPFLSTGVSEELQRLALRRLFHSPAFNALCPLEGEFFDAQGYRPLGKLVTHEMRAQLEREAARLKRKARSALESPSVDAPAPVKSSPSAATRGFASSPSPGKTKGRKAAAGKLTRVSTRRQSGRARKS